MMRESQPTLTPTRELTPDENMAYFNFLDQVTENPAFAYSCVKGYLTTSALNADARPFRLNDGNPPEGDVILAAADLVESEVVFVLELDDVSEKAIPLHTEGREVSSVKKIKGFLGELASHHMHTERTSLARVATEMGVDSQPGDSELLIVQTTDAAA